MNLALIFAILWGLNTAHTQGFISKPSVFRRDYRINPRGAIGTDNEAQCLLRPLKVRNDQAALILLPGTFLKPKQYEAVAKAIQEHSELSLWIMVPNLSISLLNPWTSKSSLTQTMKDLKIAGYLGNEVIVAAGHSWRGSFLPDTVHSINTEIKVEGRQRISGLVYLGCYETREQNLKQKKCLPSLTVTGDLDGLVRTSRIAEDFYNHVVKKGNNEETKLRHAVVVVEGMVSESFPVYNWGTSLYSESTRLEISDQSAMQKVASVVGQFLDYHVLRDQAVTQKESLLTEISNTERYLEPIMEAMLLEGSYHVADPCYACDDGETCHIGSPWIEQMQLGIAQNDSALAGKVGSVRDEFRQSWWLNPFADPPFYHPRATRGDDQKLKIETITEAVYERLDFAIDCSLVSNTALELRTKLNSPQAMLKALRVDAAFAPSDGACSSMNRKTIEWAIDHAPDIVKKRYLERGRKLVAGTDIPHSSGPSWIWSYLQYTKTGKSDEDAGDSEECVIVDSHAMNTPIEHPVPFAGGKLYCKILSPARVLDWMYTDSLRQPVR